MERNELFIIDPRLVFRGYALLAGSAGAFFLAWGPHWLGADLLGVTSLQSLLIRALGSTLVAAALCAEQFARVEEPRAQRNGLLWFGAAHAAVLITLMLQPGAVSVSRPVTLAIQFLQVATPLLFLFWSSGGNNQPAPLTTLFSAPRKESIDVLRSRYEQEIREAIGQEERNRLARELHDSIKQQIFVVQTAAATVQARFDSDANGAKNALEQVRSAARAALAELETMLGQLRAEPLGDRGLVDAIRKECEALGFRTGAKVDFRAGTIPPQEWMAPGAGRTLLRAAQESLANIGRHARPSHVAVSLDRVADYLVLRVEDDGQGFDTRAERNGMGLRNLQERAQEFDGTVAIDSRPGAGTSVVFSLPVLETDKPQVYLRNTLWAAGAAVACLALLRYTRGSSLLVVGLIAGMQALRQLTAYYHARKVRP